MIQLSFSSLSLLHDRPHCWLNKVMGIPQPEKPEWAIGKNIHRIIQDHVADIKPDKRFEHIKYKFPIVEQVDFDPRCKFSFPFWEYSIIGFIDGLDYENKRFLEIKSGDPVWSIGRFQKSFQRKIYAVAKEEFTEAILITCSKNQAEWCKELIKVYKVPLTHRDRDEAEKWIADGIKILESGNFTSDLEIIDGKPTCTDRWCYWGENCQFK